MSEALDRFREFLATQGLRLTRQRERVLDSLLEARDHLSANELQDRLRGSGVSKSTIYRTLQLLVESGLADAQEYGDGQLYYEIMIGRDHHDHLVCISCGTLTEFQAPRIEKLQDEIAQAHGFEVVSHTHKMFGFCSRCRSAPAAASRSRLPGGRQGRTGFFRDKK